MSFPLKMNFGKVDKLFEQTNYFKIVFKYFYIVKFSNLYFFALFYLTISLFAQI